MAVLAMAQITLTGMTDIEAVYRYYLLQSSTLSKPAVPTAWPPGGSWTDAEPTYTEGSTNSLYTVECTLFSDGTWQYSPVSLSTSYEAAKAAYNKAVNEGKSIRGTLELDYVKNTENDKIISMINAAADVIRLTANRLIVDSTGFKLDGNGNMTAISGTIGNLTLKDGKLTATHRHEYPTYTSDDVAKAQQYTINLVTLTEEEIARYDVNMDGQVTGLDVLSMQKMVSGTAEPYSVYQFTIDASDPHACVKVEITEGYRAGWTSSIGMGVMATRDMTVSDVLSANMMELGNPLTVDSGGTGANNANAARRTLSLPTAVTLYAQNNTLRFTITGDGSTTGTRVPVELLVGSQAAHQQRIAFNVRLSDGAPLGAFSEFGSNGSSADYVTSFLYSSTGNATTYNITFSGSGWWGHGMILFPSWYAHVSYALEAAPSTTELSSGTELAWGGPDYVVSYGTTTSDSVAWTWQKWRSGKTECWGKRNLGTVNITTAWGALYESPAFTQAFPSGLFGVAPDFLSIEFLGSGSGAAMIERGTGLSATSAGTFYLVKATSQTGMTNATVGFHAIGRWK